VLSIHKTIRLTALFTLLRIIAHTQLQLQLAGAEVRVQWTSEKRGWFDAAVEELGGLSKATAMVRTDA
jgi:hypothetical protein